MYTYHEICSRPLQAHFWEMRRYEAKTRMTSIVYSAQTAGARLQPSDSLEKECSKASSADWSMILVPEVILSLGIRHAVVLQPYLILIFPYKYSTRGEMYLYVLIRAELRLQCTYLGQKSDKNAQRYPQKFSKFH